MEIRGIRTRIFNEGEDLLKFLLSQKLNLREGDVLAITSKIVALSEGRTDKVENKKVCIQKESRNMIQTPWSLLTETDDGWAVNAGVDESNANGCIILFPQNPFQTAAKIQKALQKKYNLKNIGVLITDTRSVPLRVATIGRAVGFAGFDPIRSYRGKKDLFGRKSRYTESNIADALAASAVLVMGEGSERIPLVVIRGASVEFRKIPSPRAHPGGLSISPDGDMYGILFRKQGHGKNERLER